LISEHFFVGGLLGGIVGNLWEDGSLYWGHRQGKIFRKSVWNLDEGTMNTINEHIGQKCKVILTRCAKIDKDPTRAGGTYESVSAVA
jgi:hypothetical protein